MVYLCFASRTDLHVTPAHRTLIFVADSVSEFNINLHLAKNKYRKNYIFECVKIRHDGAFHMDTIPLEEHGI